MGNKTMFYIFFLFLTLYRLYNLQKKVGHPPLLIFTNYFAVFALLSSRARVAFLRLAVFDL